MVRTHRPWAGLALAVLVAALVVALWVTTPTGADGDPSASDGSGQAALTTRTTESTRATAPVIAAAGDIACSPRAGAYNGGQGTAVACRQRATSDLLVGRGLARVLPLGDEQYDNGDLKNFRASYDPTWGRVKSITSPVPGNHEYKTAGAAGYFDYFGAAAGPRGKGYYSYDVGAWHLVALNSNCRALPAGTGANGCAEGSPQNTWLEQDLAAHSNTCTLAYWHHPRFSSGPHGAYRVTGAFWEDLYAAGVDVVLNGHDHGYERTKLLNPSGGIDTVRGVREFVVGSGGADLSWFSTTQPVTTQVREAGTFGVLQLRLRPTGYDWTFLPIAGQTFRDTGTGTCH